ncbi:MAG: hypothetical protein EBS55_08630 [Flavobacteriaceae bacterium]|nr:hypothetical protein [Flavobacteriaceae bacterium]
MTERDYRIRISPEVIKGDIRKVNLYTSITGVNYVTQCCVLVPEPVEIKITGSTYVYSSMTDILSGSTNGTSLLTGLTIPILLTENVNDIGYYSIFDGMVLQQDTMLNFIFSGSNYTCTFKNSSDLEFKKYLEFSSYKVNWGDNSSEETLTTTSSSHTYLTSGEYEVVLTGINPWGTNRITKKVFVPFTGATTLNPRGNATFTPAGGSWATTSFSYDYIFSGDANCNSTTDDLRLFNTGNTIPFLITGYTQSSLRDLRQYGSTPYKPLISVTANTGAIGMYSGVSQDGLYTAYTINDIDYYDYQDGTTLFVTYSSGLTRDMVVCQPIVKNELLLGIIDEAEVQSNIFIERGKNSALERIQRFGEVDNIGDLEKYGYKFFNIITT